MQERPLFVGFGEFPARSWKYWVISILVFGFFIWTYLPVVTPVPYSPWLLNQVESDNIASITLSLNPPRVEGDLRQPRQYRPEARTSVVEVRRFVADLPSEDAVRSLSDVLEVGTGLAGEPVQISWSPSLSQDSPGLKVINWALWVLCSLAVGYGWGYAMGYRHGRSGRFSEDVKVVKDADPSAEPPTP